LHDNIANTAILINGAPEILQPTTETDEYLIQVPSVAQITAPSANALGAVPTKRFAPCADRLVGYGNTMFGHQFLDIAIADGEPKI
jgi:hypothetical protein